MAKDVPWVKEDDQNRILDDFVFIMVFCGNDFVPQLPFFNIMNNIIQYMIHVYK